MLCLCVCVLCVGMFGQPRRIINPPAGGDDGQNQMKERENEYGQAIIQLSCLKVDGKLMTNMLKRHSV